jgi:hypothetical protein
VIGNEIQLKTIQLFFYLKQEMSLTKLELEVKKVLDLNLKLEKLSNQNFIMMIENDNYSTKPDANIIIKN